MPASRPCPAIFNLVPYLLRHPALLQVQILIESCLQRYMSLEQTCDTLALVSVDRRFTQLVWRRLEAENREFFENYYRTQIQAMSSCLQGLDMNA